MLGIYVLWLNRRWSAEDTHAETFFVLVIIGRVGFECGNRRWCEVSWWWNRAVWNTSRLAVSDGGRRPARGVSGRLFEPQTGTDGPNGWVMWTQWCALLMLWVCGVCEWPSLPSTPVCFLTSCKQSSSHGEGCNFSSNPPQNLPFSSSSSSSPPLCFPSSALYRFGPLPPSLWGTSPFLFLRSYPGLPRCRKCLFNQKKIIFLIKCRKSRGSSARLCFVCTWGEKRWDHRAVPVVL